MIKYVNVFKRKKRGLSIFGLFIYIARSTKKNNPENVTGGWLRVPELFKTPRGGSNGRLEEVARVKAGQYSNG